LCEKNVCGVFFEGFVALGGGSERPENKEKTNKKNARGYRLVLRAREHYMTKKKAGTRKREVNETVNDII
jgi:hypothetical protein